MNNNPTPEELRKQLETVTQQLKEAELMLCEKDIENVKLQMKYNANLRKSNALEAEANECRYALSLVLNSKTWRLRNLIMAPRIKRQQRMIAAEASAWLAEDEKKGAMPIVSLSELPNDTSWEQRLQSTPRIAIQVHAFYPDLIADICNDLENLPFKYDLYVTTTETYKATYIEEYLTGRCNADHFYVKVVKNVGRDVIPFLQQLKPVLSNYDYFCHLHTKRSLHHDGGKLWRLYLYENLLGNTEHVKKIIHEFEQNPEIGVIFPQIPKPLNLQMNWGDNKEHAQTLMAAMGYDPETIPEDIIFPAGTMFWARTAAVKPLFDIAYDSEVPVPEESGQVDGTIMHAIERLWLLVAERNGYTYRVFPNISEITSITPEDR
ncbi:MAG: hypothetical protein IJD81_07020 [Oscillospiraceae bacterium]|nr:hypothetical protein [Oscillospiraceae bacterium]